MCNFRWLCASTRAQFAQSCRFARLCDRPQRNATTPRASRTNVRPIIFAMASGLCGSSAPGITENTIVIMVVAKPRTPSAIATGLPPGTRMTYWRHVLSLRPNQGGEYKQIWNEVRNNSHAYQNLIRPIDRRPGLAE